jgi:D-aminopeptidase
MSECRVFISADIEGVAGIATTLQTAALVPGVERIGPRTVQVEADPDTIFRLQELLVYRLRYEL